MGDVGSLSLGAMLAVISIALRVEWTLLLIGDYRQGDALGASE